MSDERRFVFGALIGLLLVVVMAMGQQTQSHGKHFTVVCYNALPGATYGFVKDVAVYSDPAQAQRALAKGVDDRNAWNWASHDSTTYCKVYSHE